MRTSNARELRKNPILPGKDRQRLMGQYVVDFVCLEKALVSELDGVGAYCNTPLRPAGYLRFPEEQMVGGSEISSTEILE